METAPHESQSGAEIQQVVLYQKGIGTGDMDWLQKLIAGERIPHRSLLFIAHLDF